MNSNFTRIMMLILTVIFLIGFYNQAVFSRITEKDRKQIDNDSTSYGSNSREAQKILRAINQFKDALIKEDFDKLSTFLHEDATSFNEHTKKLIKGKENVLQNLKTIMKGFSSHSKTPLKKYTIKNPYINVSGKQATATYFAVATFGGSSPCQLSSNVTEVFQKQGSAWKRLHYRGHWNFDELNCKTHPDSKISHKTGASLNLPAEKNTLKLNEMKNLQGGKKLLESIRKSLLSLSVDLERARRSLRELRWEISRSSKHKEDDNIAGGLTKPRKNWIRLYTEETVEIFDFLEEDMDAFEKNTVDTIKESDIKVALKNRLAALKNKLHEATEHKLTLVRQTRDKAMDNDHIQTTINKLQKNIDSIGQIKNSLINIFKKQSGDLSE